jgi:hypothetical protein
MIELEEQRRCNLGEQLRTKIIGPLYSLLLRNFNLQLQSQLNSQLRTEMVGRHYSQLREKLK